jgi:hypothetical protein
MPAATAANRRARSARRRSDTPILLRDVDEAQRAVVVDDGDEVDPLPHAGLDLRVGHAEAAVADRAQHRPLGELETGGHGGGKL